MAERTALRPAVLPARLLLLATVVIWGWTFIATKICLTVLTPLEVMGLRFAVGLPVLLALILARGKRLALPWRDRGVLLGALILAAHFAIQITGLKYTSAVSTAWIIAVTPLVMAVLAWLLLGERIGPATGAGIVVATAGVLLLVSHGHLASLTWLHSRGDWLVLASAHTWAAYTVVVRDAARRHDPMVLTFTVLLPAAVLGAGATVASGHLHRLLALPLPVVAALLFLGVLGTALAHWFWQAGVGRVGATEAGLFLYLEPVATTAVAVPLLGEAFGRATLAGGTLVLLGVWLAQRARGVALDATRRRRFLQ